MSSLSKSHYDFTLTHSLTHTLTLTDLSMHHRTTTCNSNYSGMFVIWDRIFGTYRVETSKQVRYEHRDGLKSELHRNTCTQLLCCVVLLCWCYLREAVTDCCLVLPAVMQNYHHVSRYKFRSYILCQPLIYPRAFDVM